MIVECKLNNEYNWKMQPQFGVIEQLVKDNVNLDEKFPAPKHNALISAIDCGQTVSRVSIDRIPVKENRSFKGFGILVQYICTDRTKTI